MSRIGYGVVLGLGQASCEGSRGGRVWSAMIIGWVVRWGWLGNTHMGWRLGYYYIQGVLGIQSIVYFINQTSGDLTALTQHHMI
jgi:hypothetical protein